MSAELHSHPSSADLRSFAHGRLAAKEMADVERHIAQCDSCCEVLATVPEDTLVQMAREAATEAFRAGEAETAPGSRSRQSIPPELADHQRYKILGLVGLGGMGAVYKAEHRLMERLVALKVISRAFTANPQAVERFRREVKAAAKLSHANIVTAHDAEQAGELHFLVMEFVDGVGLDRLIAKQGTPTISQACGLMRQAALGLQHAHDKGMVHRDIKPANLMVTRKGQVKILDFGLARLAREIASSDSRVLEAGDTGAADATAAGMILGTPDYIAPEQAADSRSADIRADIYSLGCTFYFLLTGMPPFPTGTVMQKLAAHMHQPPPPLAQVRADIPREIARIVERMMAKKPEDRYQTPSDVAKDLAAAQKGGLESPKLEPLKPADDFFAGLDLAALPPSPLSPLSSVTNAPPPQPPGSSADFSDWFAENRKLVATIGAIAGCLILAAVSVWGAGKLWGGDKRTKAVQSKELANSNPVVKKVDRAKVATVPAATASTSRARVLFCVPHDGLWEPDYLEVIPTLSQGATVTIASTQKGRCYKAGGEPSSAFATLAIGRDTIAAGDYDAILFVGANTVPFQEEPTRQLLSEFADQKKLITAICKGQEVLAHHGYFRQGLSVARSQYLQPQYQALGCVVVEEHAVKDGNIITGQDDAAGPAFAKLLLDSIPAKNP